MQIITKDGIAKYAFEDSDELQILGTKIIAPDFIIGDLNIANCILYANIEDVPQDFAGDKYLFDGEEFDPNPDYVEV